MKIKLNSKKNKFIPVSIPHISKTDIRSVENVLKKGWISSDGPEVEIFEKNFSKKIKMNYSIAVSNGTAALEIALKAIGIKKDDEVLIPNFTIISNALAVIKLNAKPIPIDCDLNTWNIKVEDIEKKISNKTKAIIVTHIYSFSNDMDRILKICKKKKIIVIEDAAEVIGLKYKNKMCGSFGYVSTFSFYANKQITSGEGGMISTNDLRIYKKCKSLRNLCFGNKQRFNHDDIGWNYRITNIQAALGISQLKRLDKTVKEKMKIGKYYYNNITNKDIYIQPPEISYSKNIYWVIGVLIKNKKITASKVIKKLNKKNIGARPFFWPMHKQKIFKKMKIFKTNYKYPNSEYLSKYGFYIPSYIGISRKTMSYISKTLNHLIK